MFVYMCIYMCVCVCVRQQPTGAGLYTGSGKESTALFEKADSKSLQKEIKELELESERKRQKSLNVSCTGIAQNVMLFHSPNITCF